MLKAIYNNNVKLGLWMKVDASLKQYDPRKLNKVLMSMVRYRSKSCQLTAERVSSEELIFSSKSSSRRVWGQKPGQLALLFLYIKYSEFTENYLVI